MALFKAPRGTSKKVASFSAKGKVSSPKMPKGKTVSIKVSKPRAAKKVKI